MSIYAYPELYATLMYPEPELLEALFAWRERWLDGPFESVMDPAAGPGTWLLPFSVRGFRVAGNDIQPRMAAEMRRRLEGADAEVLEGDMRELPFRTAPFDLALNFHASVGHLPDDAAILEHLNAVARNLRPGGLYLLGVVLNDGESLETEPELLYESEMLAVPSGGMAACHYSSVERDHRRGRETIQVLTLTTDVPDCPERIEDRYVLRTHRPEEITGLLADCGAFDFLTVYSMSDTDYAEVELEPRNRDVTLVLRRREA